MRMLKVGESEPLVLRRPPFWPTLPGAAWPAIQQPQQLDFQLNRRFLRQFVRFSSPFRTVMEAGRLI